MTAVDVALHAHTPPLDASRLLPTLTFSSPGPLFLSSLPCGAGHAPCWPKLFLFETKAYISVRLVLSVMVCLSVGVGVRAKARALLLYFAHLDVPRLGRAKRRIQMGMGIWAKTDGHGQKRGNSGSVGFLWEGKGNVLCFSFPFLAGHSFFSGCPLLFFFFRFFFSSCLFLKNLDFFFVFNSKFHVNRVYIFLIFSFL